ncbi:MAG: YidC/Oxa1 family membrane protein insertase [Lachnospiraceae bacterium]
MATVLTKSGMPLVKYVAEILGYLMNGIYLLLDKAGIPNVALAIILFTIVMYLLMTPLQISQQRFSKLNAVMNPEIQRVQAKYKGKRDQVSQQKMLDETNAIYAKYGVNQAGSCIQLLIQMPVLFALYQVIYHIPGYIGLIGGKLRVVAEDASFVSFFTKFIEKLPNNAQLTATLGTGSKLTTESVMDTIYKLNPVQWSELLKEAADKDYSAGLVSLHDYIERATNFVVMNISDTPMNLITTSFKAGQWGVLIAAVLIPLLAWGTQVLNMKLMPTANANKDSKDTMSQTMNTMNTFMPLMSAFFCLTLPVGIGIYWIAGAVVRSIQQFIINRKLDRESIDEIIAKNQKKMNDKRAKRGLPPQKITESAHVSTRTIEAENRMKEEAQAERSQRAKARAKESSAYYNANAKPGSLASKANMVRAFDEKNLKK